MMELNEKRRSLKYVVLKETGRSSAKSFVMQVSQQHHAVQTNIEVNVSLLFKCNNVVLFFEDYKVIK